MYPRQRLHRLRCASRCLDTPLVITAAHTTTTTGCTAIASAARTALEPVNHAALALAALAGARATSARARSSSSCASKPFGTVLKLVRTRLGR